MRAMRTSVIMELVDQVTRPVRRIRQAMSGLARRTGLDRVSNAARGVGDALGHTMSSLRATTRRLAMLGGVAAGAAYSMHRLISGFTQGADEALKLSRRVSMTHREVQQLMGAADLMTTGGGQMIASNLSRFSRRMAEAAAGTGEAAKAYEWAGINIRDSEGVMRSGMDVLMDIMDVMEDMESEDLQQRFAAATFGRSGEEMVNLLNQGRDEFEEAVRQYMETGQILTEEEARDAERYNDAMSLLAGTVRGIRNAVISDLLPAINEWIENMTKLARANREVISERIIQGLRNFWEWIQDVRQAVSWLADRVGGFRNLLIATAGVLAGPFLLSLTLTGVAIAKLAWTLGAVLINALVATGAALAKFTVALMATPVGWFLAAVAAIAGIAYLIYRNWEGISDFFRGLWQGVLGWTEDGIGRVVRLIASWNPVTLLARAFSSVLDWFRENSLIDLGREWIDGLRAGISERISGLAEWIGRQVDRLTGWMPDFVRERLGLDGLQSMSSEKHLGPPTSQRDGREPVFGPAARVGGELRIHIDSEGRPRVKDLRKDGEMDLDVDVGLQGLAF
ncbi:phage tail tape measure protein [Desulfonatronovibrio hydrogenovorans]|uniref:phage tail tape measure protein n=1 Tax=Desulfonatronovibrio hydrogenovorans TaxID=53245 RepID=UPI00048E5864|nr:phage tail tape measure protein [Desulfonatronovibrio hydrogenovorans]